MTVRRLALIGVMGAAAVLSACVVVSEADGSWQLVEGTHDGEPVPLVEGAPITMTVGGTGVSGFAACNHYGGEMIFQGRRVLLDGITLTEMACDEPAMESETAYVAALSGVDQFERLGQSLVLRGDAVELTYELVPTGPAAELVGTTWVLDATVEDETTASVLGVIATLELLDDGTLRGSTGCRSFEGRYEVEGDAVRVSDLTNDQGECADLAGQNEHVLSVIADGFEWVVDANRLTLTDGAIGLIYFAQVGTG